MRDGFPDGRNDRHLPWNAEAGPARAFEKRVACPSVIGNQRRTRTSQKMKRRSTTPHNGRYDKEDSAFPGWCGEPRQAKGGGGVSETLLASTGRWAGGPRRYYSMPATGLKPREFPWLPTTSRRHPKARKKMVRDGPRSSPTASSSAHCRNKRLRTAILVFEPDATNIRTKLASARWAGGRRSRAETQNCRKECFRYFGGAAANRARSSVEQRLTIPIRCLTRPLPKRC